MTLRAWIVANPFGYVIDDGQTTAFNGPYGEVEVEWLKAHPEAWIGLGVAECTFTNTPFDPRLYIPSMTFDGLEITHTGEPLELEAARTNVLNVIGDISNDASAIVNAASALTDAATTGAFEDFPAILADAEALVD